MANAAWTCNTWCSHPDAGNDDCDTGGDDFASLEEVESWLTDGFGAVSIRDGDMWVEIISPDGARTLRAPSRPRKPAREANERRELAMEAGMLGGCDAYNDAMGWGE